ncbi:MAG TPA: phosphate ABC transporter permease subunit PstC [Opitutus sp.]|nr:phosphate ABC transporter permease subunit PstC [Opitutus sp.]
MPPASVPPAARSFVIEKKRTRFLGLSLEQIFKGFFGGNALTAVVVLALITVFLFREGADFFGQNRESITIYRKAGLEYVDIMRQQLDDHTALTRYLFDIRMRAVRYLTEEEKLKIADANARLSAFDEFAGRYSDAVEPIRGFVSELSDVAVEIKTKYRINEDAKIERQQYLQAGMTAEADAVEIKEVDFEAEVATLVSVTPAYNAAAAEVSVALSGVVALPPPMPTPELRSAVQRFQALTHEYLGTFPETQRKLDSWDYRKPVPFWDNVTGFIFGREWITASFWQDWYGVLPLFVGSLMVSIIALVLAVPLGVGAAIYINQFASLREQRLIKPAIEFISAIPSVVLGFFGIAVLGQALRALSQVEALSWVPGFPFAERLNALTAGCLLALIAVPTIFTLAEDALNNVPRSFREASLALGASRMQTILRIVVPASLSGIMSAVLLGFGRVIGETMVVLLCAGNRIAIPDFSQGLAAFVQPVHTMTGIIAQEMGEVVRGDIHYRALFMVGLVLFFLALLINFFAQKIVRRYRISIG